MIKNRWQKSIATKNHHIDVYKLVNKNFLDGSIKIEHKIPLGKTMLFDARFTFFNGARRPVTCHRLGFYA